MHRIAQKNLKFRANSGCSIRWPYHPLVVLALLLAPVPGWPTGWKPLTDTGQALCYDTNGTETTCPTAGQTFYGQDAHYQGAPPNFQDNGNHTVTDRNTGLIWIESDETIQHPWEDAISYCNELTFADHSDWRLPTKFELESIVDYGKFYPAINQAFSCQSSFYWSATPHAANPAYAWSVFCMDGADHWVHTSNNYYVRCVRAGI